MQTLSADFLLRKHNLEYYLTEQINPKLFFINALPTAITETGEFPTVLTGKTITEDLADGTTSEPLDTAEASELTEIDISPINAQIGRTNIVGYKFKYSDKFLKRSDADARLQVALAKMVGGISIKINNTILTGMVGAAAGTVPNDLSDWDATADPRADFIKLRKEFRNNGAFQLNKVFLGEDRFVTLEEYYMSMDYPFDSNMINVDGTSVQNCFEGLDGTGAEFIGYDVNIPPGIVEKYLNPDFSVITKTTMNAKPRERENIPDAIINVNQFRDTEHPYDWGYDVWAELGYASLEPTALIKGTF